MNPFSKWTIQDVERHNQSVGKASHPIPEPIVRNEPLDAAEGKAGHAKRISIRIESRRRRLIDPDNLCPKYFIDCLRYAEIIPDDTAKDVELQISQRKVASKDEEGTLITVG